MAEEEKKGIIERIKEFRTIIPEERKLLDKIMAKMQTIAQFIYWYPFINHKRITPEVKKEMDELLPLVERWEEVIKKKKVKEKLRDIV